MMNNSGAGVKFSEFKLNNCRKNKKNAIFLMLLGVDRIFDGSKSLYRDWCGTFFYIEVSECCQV